MTSKGRGEHFKPPERLKQPDYNKRFNSKEREAINSTVDALVALKETVRKNILKVKEQIDKTEKELNALRDDVKNHVTRMSAEELILKVQEVETKQEALSKLEKDIELEWGRITFGHKQLERSLLEKLGDSQKIEGLLKKIKNPESIKQNFGNEPFKLFLELDEVIYILKKVTIT